MTLMEMGAGPSGEGTSNEVDRPTSGYIQHPNLIENWIGNLYTRDKEALIVRKRIPVTMVALMILQGSIFDFL